MNFFVLFYILLSIKYSRLWIKKKKIFFTFSEIILYEHISFGFCRRMNLHGKMEPTINFQKIQQKTDIVDLECLINSDMKKKKKWLFLVRASVVQFHPNFMLGWQMQPNLEFNFRCVSACGRHVSRDLDIFFFFLYKPCIT